MKRKHVFSVLLAMIFALTFCWTAMAANDACVDCGKCPDRQIKCCKTLAQGEKEGFYFDYEIGVGYCQDIPNPNWCKVVFDLCECDDPNTNFASGSQIGVHMTILNTGVYFTDDPVRATMYMDPDDACKGVNPFWGPFLPQATTYYDALGKKVTPMPLNYAPYYTSCEVPCDQLAMELVTCAFIPVTQAVVDNEAKYWWVDIPAMVLNNSMIAGREGEMIRVEVCLQASGTGICRECDDICCCIIEVGTLCCEEERCERKCIYFPYVVTGLTGIGWHSGIVITNVGGDESLDLTLTITDAMGDQFTYKKDGHTVAVWAFYLDSILAEFSGTPAAGPAMLKVSAKEGVLDGYAFLQDDENMFGGSTLARDCSCSAGF